MCNLYRRRVELTRENKKLMLEMSEKIIKQRKKTDVSKKPMDKRKKSGMAKRDIIGQKQQSSICPAFRMIG